MVHFGMPRRTDRELLRAIGSRIAELRTQRKMTQEQLAVGAGLEPMTVSRVERGVRALSLANLAAVAETLDVELPALLEVQDASDAASEPDPGEAAWRTLWAQLPEDRKELAVHLVQVLIRK